MFFVPMHVCMQGFRTIYDEKAVAFDSFSLNLDLEKRRKVRTLAGNWQLLILEPNLLNPLKNPLWIRFLSHKIFRLLVPYCLIVLVILSCCLKTVYAIIFLSFIFPWVHDLDSSSFQRCPKSLFKGCYNLPDLNDPELFCSARTI